MDAPLAKRLRKGGSSVDCLCFSVGNRDIATGCYKGSLFSTVVYIVNIVTSTLHYGFVSIDYIVYPLLRQWACSLETASAWL